MKKCKLLFSKSIDIILITAAISLSLLGILFVRKMLYKAEGPPEKLCIVTEAMTKEISECISVGDPIYDNLTKRQLGVIESLVPLDEGEYVRLYISFFASASPRRDSLRTKRVWFRFTKEEIS